MSGRRSGRKSVKKPAPPSPISDLLAESGTPETKPIITSTAITQRAPASRIVYDTPQLRAKIFSDVDQATLAGMMALEKGAVAAVAAVLYRSIHTSVVPQIGRSSPRRDVYCHSVREIDRSPPRIPTTNQSTSSPTTLDVLSLVENIASLRLAFPSLQKISLLEPPHVEDDSYIVRLSEDQVILDLRKHVDLNIARTPTPSDGLLPPRPAQVAGVLIRQSIRLSVGNSAAKLTHAAADRWNLWLFHNPALDSRISEIILSPDLSFKFPRSPGDVIAFLAARKARLCTPPQGVSVTLADESAYSRIKDIAVQTGPDILSLQLDATMEIPDWPRAISAVAQSFPLLHHLVITDGSRTFDVSTPLSGLPDLRSFAYEARGQWDRQSVPPLGLARYLYRLGSATCAYSFPDYSQASMVGELHSLVRKLKSSYTEYAYLHSINEADLDMWQPSDIRYYARPIDGTHVKRRGWARSDAHASSLLVKREGLGTLVDRHKEAAEKFRQVFAGAVEGMAGLEGNVKAQGEVIKGRFESAEKLKEDLRVASAAVQKSMNEMDNAVSVAAEYARQWLKHQRGGQGSQK